MGDKASFRDASAYAEGMEQNLPTNNNSRGHSDRVPVGVVSEWRGLPALLILQELGLNLGGGLCPNLQLLLPQLPWPSATPLASLQGQAWGTKQEHLAKH